MRVLIALLAVLISSPAAGDPTVAFLLKWTSPSAFDVASAPDGTVLVTDLEWVKRYTGDGTFLQQWQLPPVGINAHGQPGLLAIDSRGFAYFTAGFGYVQKTTLDGTPVVQWRVQQTTSGISPQAFGITVGSDGNIFTADSRSRNIQKFTPSGAFLSRWTTVGSPGGIAADRAGRIYSLESGDFGLQVEVYDVNGVFQFAFGPDGLGEGEFQGFGDVGVDAAGNVFISDGNFQRVQEFGPDGSFIAVLGSAGTGDGEFQVPLGISTDGDGNVYVADSPASRVQKFGPAPVPVASATWGRIRAAYRGTADHGP